MTDNYLIYCHNFVINLSFNCHFHPIESASFAPKKQFLFGEQQIIQQIIGFKKNAKIPF